MSTKFGRRGIAALKSVASKRLVPGNNNDGPPALLDEVESASDPQTTLFTVKLSFLDSTEREFELVQSNTVADLLQAVHAQFSSQWTIPLEQFVSQYAIFLLLLGKTQDTEGRENEGSSPIAEHQSCSRRLDCSEVLYTVQQNVQGRAMKLVFKNNIVNNHFPPPLNQSLSLAGFNLQFAMMECMFMIATGRYFLTEDEAMQIGGLLLQIEHGDLHPTRHSNEFIKTMILTIFPNPLRKEFQSLVSFQTTVTKKYIDRYIARARLCYARLSGTSRISAQRQLIQYVQMFTPFYNSYQLPLAISPTALPKNRVQSINNIEIPLEVGELMTIALTDRKMLLVTKKGVIIQQPFHMIMKWSIDKNEKEFRYWVLLEDNSLAYTGEKDGGAEKDGKVPSLLSSQMRESMVQLGRCDVVCLEISDAHGAREIALKVEKIYSPEREEILPTENTEVNTNLTVTTSTTTALTTAESVGEEVETLLSATNTLSVNESVYSFGWIFRDFSADNNELVKCCDISSIGGSLSWESVRMENHANILLVLLQEDDEDEGDEVDEMRLHVADLDLSLALASADPESFEGEEENGDIHDRGSQSVSASKKSSGHLSLKGLRKASRRLFHMPANNNNSSSTAIGAHANRAESKRFVSAPASNGASIGSSSVTTMYRQSSKYRGVPYSLISGEDMMFEIDDQVDWTINTVKQFRGQHVFSGSVCVTNYRIILTAHWLDQEMNPSKLVPNAFKEISVPVASIHKVGLSSAHKDSLYVYCRDYRVVRITINDPEHYKEKQAELLQTLNELLYPLAGSVNNNRETARMIKVRSKLFAYFNTSLLHLNDMAWDLSDMRDEYGRQGLTSLECWQVFDNSNYSLSDTYPSYLALPRYMDDEQIRTAAAFRSRGRLPAITYRHAKTGALLTRSSQPFVGLIQKKCAEDELLLNLYRCKGKVVQSEQDKLYILDARGKVAAALNMASGRGTEDVSVYGNAELIFGNIENIHVMRSSIESFVEHLSVGSSPFSDTKDLIQSTETANTIFYTNLDESGWLKHIRMILLSGILAAEKLHLEGQSVLVHCSDGWDRTAQICCTAELLLDPYYRTITGFAVLIEKDWCAFGHKFHDRYGCGQESSSSPDEKSPVFTQFLDAVYQLLLQFPTAFEFTEELLLFIANHVFSGLFGNFLGNSDKERKTMYEVTSSTKSIWAYVLQYKSKFLNPSFTPTNLPIWPSAAMHRTKVWERYWLRCDLAAHPRPIEGIQQQGWDDDWGSKGHV